MSLLRAGRWVAVACVLLLSSASVATADNTLDRVLEMPAASLVVEEQGKLVIARQPDRPMVPASTMKILTALAAIERWGLDHRFATEFFVDEGGWLWVRGGGDPFLVSEELDLIVAALIDSGITQLRGVATDSTRFLTGAQIDGRSATNNPYDAPVSALSVNFNTVAVKVAAGKVTSAEPQTPITPLARSLARGLKSGRHRVNLRDQALAPRYFAEILIAKLRSAGVSVGDQWQAGSSPQGLSPIYVHHSSRDLRQVLRAMLDYSNNFIANQLFILLGDSGSGEPLSVSGARGVINGWTSARFGWNDFHVEEGAGLSRKNRLSGRQMLALLEEFAPYRDLLPEESPGVLAKTGTLRGVSCLAGYLWRETNWVPFSLMINQSVPYDTRLRVARTLVDATDLDAVCNGRRC